MKKIITLLIAAGLASAVLVGAGCLDLSQTTHQEQNDVKDLAELIQELRNAGLTDAEILERLNSLEE